MSDKHPVSNDNIDTSRAMTGPFGPGNTSDKIPHPLEPIRDLVRRIGDEARILLSGLPIDVKSAHNRLTTIIEMAQLACNILSAAPATLAPPAPTTQAVEPVEQVEGAEGDVTVGEVELGAADIDIDGGGWEDQADTNTGDAQAEPDATAEPAVIEDKPTTNPNPNPNPNPNARKHAAKKSRAR